MIHPRERPRLVSKRSGFFIVASVAVMLLMGLLSLFGAYQLALADWQAVEEDLALSKM